MIVRKRTNLKHKKHLKHVRKRTNPYIQTRKS